MSWLWKLFLCRNSKPSRVTRDKATRNQTDLLPWRKVSKGSTFFWETLSEMCWKLTGVPLLGCFIVTLFMYACTSLVFLLSASRWLKRKAIEKLWKMCPSETHGSHDELESWFKEKQNNYSHQGGNTFLYIYIPTSNFTEKVPGILLFSPSTLLHLNLKKMPSFIYSLLFEF